MIFTENIHKTIKIINAIYFIQATLKTFLSTRDSTCGIFILICEKIRMFCIPKLTSF